MKSIQKAAFLGILQISALWLAKKRPFNLLFWNAKWTCIEIEVRCSHLKLRYRPYFEEFLGIQTTIEYGFTLKRVRDMIRTHSQMHCTDKYSQHSSIIWPVWPNGWVFIYELSGCGFEARCSHLNFRCRPYFEVFLDVQANIECGVNLKRVREMTRTYSRCW